MVKKDSDTNKVMQGVEFMLEYLPLSDDEPSDKFLTVYVVKKQDANGEYYEFVELSEGGTLPEGAVAANEILTDENGKIRFTKLPSSATYKLTEVSTLTGYNLLASPLEFVLPYYMENGTTSSDGFVTVDENNKSDNYYYDVTYTITNSRIPNMPFSGNSAVSNFVYLLLVLSALLIATVLIVLAVRHTKKSLNTNTIK